MKRHVYSLLQSIAILWGLTSCLSACQSDHDSILDENQKTVQIYTSMPHSSASLLPNGEKLTACLIFWEQAAYQEKFKQTKAWGAPFLVVKPEYEIDYYRVENGTPYNTQHSYPLGQGKLHVMGFAPAQLTSDDNYQTLQVPIELQNGKVDFLSGDGNNKRVGWANNPFEQGDKMEKELQFCHLTAKIRVKAKRHPNLFQRIGIKNVTVKLKEQKVPTVIGWEEFNKKEFIENDFSGYTPWEHAEKEIVMKAPQDAPILQNETQLVDSCYVSAEKDLINEGGHSHSATTIPTAPTSNLELKMDIEAELMPWNGNGWDTEHVTTRKWENQEVRIINTTGDKLKMGHAYSILITFNIHDLRLQGQEMPWESGGKHYVPITPVK